LGAGSYYQASPDAPVLAGEWMHYVLIINTTDAAASGKYPTGYTKLYYELSPEQVAANPRQMRR
jgi:hypothetical protein